MNVAINFFFKYRNLLVKNTRREEVKKKFYLRKCSHGTAPGLIKLLHLLVRHLLLVWVSHLMRLLGVRVLQDSVHIKLNITLVTARLTSILKTI